MGLKMRLKQLMVVKKIKFDKDFMRIKIDSDDNLPLKKPLKFPTMTIIFRSIFEEDGKFCPQINLGERFYGL